MLEEITDIIGCEVYTNDAVYVGNIKDIIMEVDKKMVEGIYIENPNPALVEGGVNISVPFRWVNALGDIVVLRYFPKYVKTGTRGPVEESDDLQELVES